MKLKYLRLFPLVATAIFGGIGYALSHPLIFNLCNRLYVFNDVTGCLDKSIETIGQPLLIFSLFLVPVVLILLFISDSAFKSWLWLALVWLPLSIICVALTPDSSNQVISYSSIINHENTAIVMGGLFTLISLILIAWKTLAARNAQ